MTPGELIQAHLDAYGLYSCPCGYWTTELDYMAKHRLSCANVVDAVPELYRSSEERKMK